MGERSTVPESQSPLHLSEHAHYVTSCLWFGCWCQKWDFCWFGGWGSRCNVRVLFVSSLFLLFLSFCTIIPFFILYVFSSLSLWHLLFTVKMMMLMCPSTCLPPRGKWEHRLCKLSSEWGWGRVQVGRGKGWRLEFRQGSHTDLEIGMKWILIISRSF